MSEDISFLPDEIRDKEEKIRKNSPPSPTEDRLKMYVPQAEEDDIEVIEVDEGEVGDILGNEPLLTQIVFKIQEGIDALKVKLFSPRISEPPPKVPPQFFVPPVSTRPTKASPTPSGLIPIAGVTPVPPKPPTHIPASVPTPPSPSSSVSSPVPPAPSVVRSPTPPFVVVPPSVVRLSSSDIKTKARILPTATVPRRVRVIRRVRRPVQVSFLNEQTFVARIDIPRRRFTLIILGIVFSLLLGGSYVLLRVQGRRAQADLVQVQAQLTDMQAQEHTIQDQWTTYRDLEPRLKTLSQLLDRHLSPSRVFDALEAHTVPTVFYSSFVLSPDGDLVLLATAPSFGEAARQVLAFQEAGIATSVRALGYQARYNNVSGHLEGVSFQITMKLDPEVLRTSTQPRAVTK